MELFNSKVQSSQPANQSVQGSAEKYHAPLILRPSLIFLATKIIMIEVVFAVMYLVVRLPKNLLLDFGFISDDSLVSASWYLVVYYLVITFFQLLVIMYIVVKWINEYYEVTPGTIEKKRGVFNRKEESYQLRNVEAIFVNQGFLGKIFNYGDVKIQSPVIKNDFFLSSIPNPTKYAQMIEESIPSLSPLRFVPKK